MVSSKWLLWFERGWRWVLHAGFLLLCLRFLVAATGAVFPTGGAVLVIALGSLGLSVWRPAAALFAFTASVPLLNGLGYVGLAGLPTPLSAVFSGVFVGWIIRQIASRLKGEKQKAESGKHEAEGGNEKPNLKLSISLLTTDILITVVLASLVMQIVRHHDAAGFWPAFRGQPVFGYGDPLYFITSAFVWLQGLFFFRMLSVQDGNVVAWAKPLFVVYGSTLAAFYLFQLCFRTPEPSDTITYCSPFEDIHSFGSIVVAVFAFAVASWQKRPWIRTALYGIGVIGLLALVVASWSRATWLAGVLVLTLVAWIRLSKKWTAVLVGLGVIAVVILNANAGRESWNRNPYLWRLISLVRVENPTNKSPERFNLYHKTVGMIREHPFVGHGIGSIYLTSVRFARHGDPYADVPTFAHNFLLQMAAEMGVPAATLFAVLIVFALWKGFRKWKAKSGRHEGRTEFEILGVTMALTAYLITQMTANALNIYVSNQFFFWFLMAALLSGSDGRNPPSPSGLWRTREAQEVAK
jgi:O-antigen ligase